MFFVGIFNAGWKNERRYYDADKFNVCQLMEVEFCDHIIIGGDNYFSFREDYSREQKKKREEKKKEEQA